MDKQKINIYGKVFVFKRSDQATDMIDALRELDKEIHDEIRCCLCGPGFMRFGQYYWGAKVIGELMFAATFGPQYGEDKEVEAVRKKVLQHVVIDEKLSDRNYGIPYLFVTFTDDIIERWHGELMALIEEVAKVRAAVRDEEVAAAKKEQEERKRWKQVKVYSRYIPPYDSGENGRVDSLFTNGSCSIRMVQTFIFDGGIGIFPQRIMENWCSRKDYTEEENDLISWLCKYGTFSGRSILE